MEKEKIRISADDMLAAMLYYFDKIDQIDFALLSNYIVEELKKNPDFEIVVSGVKDISHKFEFYKHGEDDYEIVWGNNRGRTAKLTSFDYYKNRFYILTYDKDDKGRYIDVITLRDKKYRESLTQIDIYGNSQILFNILSRYDNIKDKEEYYKYKKEKVLQTSKKINDVNILLISDQPEDYETLIKCGFKNINWFKSIVRAKRYFDEHPNELANHHITFIGEQSINTEYAVFYLAEPDLELKKTIEKVCKEKGLQKFRLYSWNSKEKPDERNLFTSEEYVFNENGTCQKFKLDSSIRGGHLTEEEFCNKIVEFLLVKYPNGIIPTLDFNKVYDYINPDVKPYPKKISDIKILTYSDDNNLREKYGLNITTCDDLFPTNNDKDSKSYYEFRKYLKEHLADYDIFILKKSDYASRILQGKESTEQCKDTGKPLTLLVAYEDYPAYGNIISTGIRLNYSVGGISQQKTLNNNYSFGLAHNRLYYPESHYFEEEHAIRGSLHLYNQLLIARGEEPIKLPFVSPEVLNQEYEKKCELFWNNYLKVNKIDAQNIELIRQYDDAMNLIREYLRYYNSGKITEIPVGLNFVVNCDNLNIEVQYIDTNTGRPYGSVIFNKNESKPGLRKFIIKEYDPQKNNYKSSKEVGVYINSWNDEIEAPRRPNNEELISICEIMNMIKEQLSPLIENAQIEIKSQKRKRKRKR